MDYSQLEDDESHTQQSLEVVDGRAHHGVAKRNKTVHRVALIGGGILCIALAVITIYFVRNFAESQIHDGKQLTEADVLPNTTLTVALSNDTRLQGQFVVDDGELQVSFDFLSSVQDDSQLDNNMVSFMATTTAAATLLSGWKGFTMSSEGEGQDLTFHIYQFDSDTPTEIVMHSDSPLAQNDQDTLGNAFSSLMGKYFVELSVKLGAHGIIGADSPPAKVLYEFAKWVDQMVETGTYGSHWEDLDSEYEKANEVVSVLRDPLKKNHRRLGGSCSISNTCGNACYGMCGDGCNCWSWVCGDCGCWVGCRDHDYHCSCEGTWTLGCANVFGVPFNCY